MYTNLPITGNLQYKISLKPWHPEVPKVNK